MKTQDNLFKYMKELPVEAPSADFTMKVMDHIRVEKIKTPAIYQPLISRKMWLKICIGFAIILLGGAILYSFFPDNDTPALITSLYKIDFSFLLKLFQSLSNVLNKIPLTIVGGLLAISLLLLGDQLHTKFIAH
jgi:hypothetical protein